MNLFFMHIPKTGGGTFHKTLAPLFYNIAPRMSWVQTPNYDFEKEGHDFIFGHYPHAFTQRLNDTWLFCTLLRDPVERVLSHYSYVHEFGYHPAPLESSGTRQHHRAPDKPRRHQQQANRENRRYKPA